MPGEIDKFLASKRSNDKRSQDEAALLALAKSVCAQRFTELANQVEADTSRISVGAGERIEFTKETDQRLDGYISVIRDSTFPTFQMRIDRDCDGQPIFHARKTIKMSADAGSTQKAFDIEVIAKAQGQYFYRVGGEDKSVEDLSDWLLAPVLKFL